MRSLTPGIDLITHLAFSPDGRLLVAVGDKGVAIYDWPPSDAPAVVVPSPERIAQVSWKPSGDVFATGSLDGFVQIWTPRGRLKNEITAIRGNEGMTETVAFSPDGRFLAFGGGWWDESGHIAIVETQRWRVVAEVEAHQNIVGSLAFAGNDLLLSGGADRCVLTHQFRPPHLQEAEQKSISVPAQVQAIMVRPDGMQMAIATGGRIFLWPMVNGRISVSLNAPTCRGHERSVRGIAYSPDGLTLVSTGEDGTFRVWDAETSMLRSTFTPGLGVLRTIAVAPDGLTVAVAGNKGTISIFDLE